MVFCRNDLFFPPDCYCTRSPRIVFQVRNAPGVALRTVLQLANRIIIYMQMLWRDFAIPLFFPSWLKYGNSWLIQPLEGSFGATITLLERCLLRTLGAGHVWLCFSFLKSKYSQRHYLHRVMIPICTFFFLWVRGKKLRCEELKGRSETDMAKRTEMNKGSSSLCAEPLRATLARACSYCLTFLPWQNGGNRNKCNGGKCIYDY